MNCLAQCVAVSNISISLPWHCGPLLPPLNPCFRHTQGGEVPWPAQSTILWGLQVSRLRSTGIGSGSISGVGSPAPGRDCPLHHRLPHLVRMPATPHGTARTVRATEGLALRTSEHVSGWSCVPCVPVCPVSPVSPVSHVPCVPVCSCVPCVPLVCPLCAPVPSALVSSVSPVCPVILVCPVCPCVPCVPCVPCARVCPHVPCVPCVPLCPLCAPLCPVHPSALYALCGQFSSGCRAEFQSVSA